MSSARRTTKPALRSTDRGGLLSLSVGIVLIAFGIGLLVGLFQQTTSASLRWFLYVSLGLGGLLYPVVPVLVLWLGALLVLSSRRYVSFRAFVLSFVFYMCLGATVTLCTNVQGFGSLMDYTHKVNKNYLPVQDPGGYSAYLSLAFRRYGDTMTPVPGGGWLGMVLAYPLWRLAGTTWSLVLLILAMISLFFGMIRRTPASLIRALDARRARRQPKEEAPQQVPVLGMDPVAQPATEQADAPVAASPEITPAEPVVEEPASQQPGPVQRSIPIPAYTPPQPVPSYEEDMEEDDNGFIPIQQGAVVTYAEVAPSARPAATSQAGSEAPRTPVTSQPAHEQRSTPVVPAAPVVQQEPVPQSAPVVEHPIAPPQPAPAVETPKPAAPVPAATKIAAAASKPIQPQPVPAPAPVRNAPVREVNTAPAVPLTGKRILVNPLPAASTGERRMDGMVDGTQRKHMQLQWTGSNYERPPFRLLTEPPANQDTDTTEADQARAENLIQTLENFNISAQLHQVVRGPAVTRFAIRLAEGVNVSRLRNVMDNVSMELLSKSPARAEIPIPGTRLIGIEVSNDKSTPVYLREVLESQKMREAKTPTTVALGLDITGTPVLCDLMDMPHLLIAGATGSGKSVCINSIITSLLYCASPDAVRLILVDPKYVELQPYNDIPHLLLPVITDPKKAVSALEWVCQEMDERYQKLQKTGTRNVDAYNAKMGSDEEKLSKLIVIVDEMADLMATSGKVIDEHIKRITAKARAAGICLILATQRPSVDVITGVIKANIPSRIAFQVSSLVDSRTILDGPGAEKLLGFGDMLYLPRNYSSPKRVQGCLTTDADVSRVVEYVKSHNTPNYNLDIMEHIEKGGNEANGNGSLAADDADSAEFDELLPKAIEMAVEAGQMSISMLQRVLRVGYGRAGRLIDEMDRRGIISGNEGTKARKTLITREEYANMQGDL